MNEHLKEEVEDREKWLLYRQMCGDYEATFFTLEEADPWYDLEWVEECCRLLREEKRNASNADKGSGEMGSGQTIVKCQFDGRKINEIYSRPICKFNLSGICQEPLIEIVTAPSGSPDEGPIRDAAICLGWRKEER